MKAIALTLKTLTLNPLILNPLILKTLIKRPIAAEFSFDYHRAGCYEQDP